MRHKTVATVWVFVEEARNQGLDASIEWAKKNSPAFHWYNPVEINIPVSEVPKALEKWNKISGEENVRVDYKPYERWMYPLNKVYA